MTSKYFQRNLKKFLIKKFLTQFNSKKLIENKFIINILKKIFFFFFFFFNNLHKITRLFIYLFIYFLLENSSIIINGFIFLYLSHFNYICLNYSDFIENHLNSHYFHLYLRFKIKLDP